MANGSVRIDVDTSGASQNVKRLVDELNKLPKPLDGASQSISQLVSSAKDAGKSLTTASKDSVTLAQALGKVGTSAKTPREELKQLKSALEEATVAYNRLSDQEKAGEFGKALKQSIGDLTERAKSLKSSFAEVNRSLQDNKEKAKESGGALDFLEKKLGMSITSFTKFASVGGAVAGTLKVAKDAFLQNESGIDEWGRTVESAKAAYNVFLDTINGGNWSNFFTNLNDAITGARDLYDAIDRLGSVKANNQSAIAIAQAQIQKLRVLKQQGKDVDVQLKQAEANLKKLQGQQVEAGKNAGRKQIAEEIRQRYQSQQGAGTLSQGVLDYVTKQIIEKGQSFFDVQKRVYEQLEKKGQVSKTSQTMTATGQVISGGTYKEFSMSALTPAEQVKYRLSKAITEGETAIQQGIGMFSQAVNEEAQSYRDEFKANRYLKSGGSGGGNKKEEPVFDASAQTLKGMRDNVAVLTKSLDTMKVGTDEYNQVLKQKIEWEDKLRQQQQYNSDLSTFYSGARAKPAKIDRGPEIDLFHQMSPEEEKKYSQVKLPKELTKAPKKEKKDKGDGEQMKMIGEISDNISGMLSSLEAIGFEVPAEIRQVVDGINTVCTVVQTIQTIVMIIQALEALTAAKPLASGGIVHAASGTVMGKNYIDRVPATLSSGEMVMNEADQSSLWQAIKSGNFGGGSAQPYVKAEDIWLGMNNMFKRKGMGKVAFVKS